MRENAYVILAIATVFSARRFRKSSGSDTRKRSSLLIVEIAAIIFVIIQFPIINTLIEQARHSPPETIAMSEAETNNVMTSISRCWGISAEESTLPVVNIYVLVNPDTSVQTIHVIDAEKERYNNDAVYRRTADRAMNALKTCSPFTFLPKGKYEIWNELYLTFDPQMGH